MRADVCRACNSRIAKTLCNLVAQIGNVSLGSFVTSGSYKLTLKLVSSSWETSARSASLAVSAPDRAFRDTHRLFDMAAMRMSLLGAFAPSTSPLLRTPAKLPGDLHCILYLVRSEVIDTGQGIDTGDTVEKALTA